MSKPKLKSFAVGVMIEDMVLAFRSITVEMIVTSSRVKRSVGEKFRRSWSVIKVFRPALLKTIP